MLLLELHQDFAVGGPDGAGIAVSHVDTGVGQTDIIQHRVQIFFRDGLANYLVDLVGQPCGLLDAEARPRAQVQPDLARVYAGEKVAPEYEREADREHAKNKEAGDK